MYCYHCVDHSGLMGVLVGLLDLLELQNARESGLDWYQFVCFFYCWVAIYGFTDDQELVIVIRCRH